MKANAITRIIIFSIVIVILLAVLATGLGLGTFLFNFDLSTGEYISGGSSVSATAVHNLEIEWAAGNIKIETADVDTINFSESGHIADGQEMVYEHNGDTLTLHYCKPGLQIGFFSTPAKDLTITVPSSWKCDSLSVDAAATDISASNLDICSIDLNSASGSCQFTNCKVTDFEADTASGNIYFSGSLQTLDCDAASADITAVFTEIPREINMDGASGDLDITLPLECGFAVNMDTLSGKFSSDFTTTVINDNYICGDGYCKINVDSASGNLIIRKTTK